MPNQHYELVPVSEGLPEEEGWYFVMLRITPSILFFKDGAWDLSPLLTDYVTHWLRPVPGDLEGEVDRLREALIELAMRANLAFPTNEQEDLWFSEGTKTEYMLTLFEIIDQARKALSNETRKG